MAVYIVNYDLNQTGQNYNCLIKKLESYPTYWHMQDSSWIIISNDKVETIRNNLISCLDSNDELFIGKLSGTAAWAGYGDEINKWIKNVLRNQTVAA